MSVADFVCMNRQIQCIGADYFGLAMDLSTYGQISECAENGIGALQMGVGFFNQSINNSIKSSKPAHRTKYNPLVEQTLGISRPKNCY